MARKSLLFIPLVLLIAACGTVATPVFEEQLEETRVAQAATSDAATAAAPTATETPAPSETPLPTETSAPTNTPAPATNTPEPATATTEPTAAPTEVESAAPAGNAANGQVLFTTFIAQANFACSTCHLVDSEAQLIGPGLLNVAARAETRVPGQTADEYLHNSILHPSDFVVENYPDMLMPQVYGTVFTEDEINDLVAYLYTLNG